MSRKMKGVALGSLPDGQFLDAKAKIKHQALLQDYQELVKETEATRNKMMTMKRRKLILLAEVQFLRRRHKYLLENKAAKPNQGEPQFDTQKRKTVKEEGYNRKKATLRKQCLGFDANQRERINRVTESDRSDSPNFDLNRKVKVHGGKEASLRSITRPFDLNEKGRTQGDKEASFWNPTQTITDLNQKQRSYSGKETTFRNAAPVFDLNQMERTHIGREDTAQNRAPIFDLNQTSGEEEELHLNYDSLITEEPKKYVMRGGPDEQLNDLKLSICRNVGNGPNRAGKRKVSWQDQVALKV